MKRVKIKTSSELRKERIEKRMDGGMSWWAAEAMEDPYDLENLKTLVMFLLEKQGYE